MVEGIVPANFSVTDVQSRSINFTWEAPDTDLTIIGYTVGCSGTLNQDDIMAPVTTASIGGLVPFTNYSCFVFTRVNGNRGNSTGAIIELTSEEGKIYETSKILQYRKWRIFRVTNISCDKFLC